MWLCAQNNIYFPCWQKSIVGTATPSQLVCIWQEVWGWESQWEYAWTLDGWTVQDWKTKQIECILEEKEAQSSVEQYPIGMHNVTCTLHKDKTCSPRWGGFSTVYLVFDKYLSLMLGGAIDPRSRPTPHPTPPHTISHSPLSPRNASTIHFPLCGSERVGMKNYLICHLSYNTVFMIKLLEKLQKVCIDRFPFQKNLQTR